MIQSIEKGIQEAGYRSIADKIIKRLHDLEKTIENNQGRWAWELLQNAKDSIANDDDSRTVSVKIILNESSVEFQHNGTHFTDQDVIGLISQISSKEVEEGQQTKKTGRFGTGFLTTHLLSRVIKIKGILKAEERLHEFEFLLDRQGEKVSELIPRISTSWDDFRKSIKEIRSDYHQNHSNTSFVYKLETEKQRRIAKIGVEEFSKLIPFVLAFIPKIVNVEIIDYVAGITTSFEKNKKFNDELISCISIQLNSEKQNIFILCSSNDKVAIATEVESHEIGYSIKSIKNFPKLFCDFPLIGTEDFHFPVIVNSFFFNPQTERDGIWLKGSDDPEVQENRKILESAVELYKDLLVKISDKKFFDLYHLAESKIPSTDSRYFDEQWYKELIQKPLRQSIYQAKIVEIESQNFEKRTIEDLHFPKSSFSESIRKKLWQFTFDLAPNVVCKKVHINNWCDISWEEWKTLDYEILANTVAKKETLSKLSHDLKKNDNGTVDWLNSLGRFFLEDDKNLSLFKQYSTIPNQNGKFNNTKNLYIDEIQDDDLVYILELLGDDWKEILLHDGIHFIIDHIQNKNKKDIAGEITKILNKKLKNSSDDDNLKIAISLLCEWFEKNLKQGEELFSELYRKRAEIFMNTIDDKESLYKIMQTSTDLSKLAELAQALEGDPEIIEKIKKVSNLLEESNAEDISDLKNKLMLAQNVLSDDSKKIEITPEVLLSLGVTSIQELEEALQDKGIEAKFIHTSTPKIESFLAVQKLIERAKNNVIKYLKSLKIYDCTDLEELATTTIGGIKKDGVDISIVVRPSDNGEVIIHYSSEKDVLEEANSELWIDNGMEQPKRLTLGKILKTTGINRIPV